MKEFFKNKKNIVLLVMILVLAILEVSKFLGSVLIIYAAVIFELLLILVAIVFYCTKSPTKVLTLVSLVMCVAFLIPNLIVFRKGASAQTGYVLHAGGGIQGAAYLNSKEGFEHYVKDGNNLIEIDFLYTSDEKIVCAHEFEKFKGYSLSKRPDLETFENYLIEGEYHGMTYEWLLDKLEEYPEVKIIFDTKEKEADKILAEMIEIADEKGFDILNRFIVQVYSKENYNYIKDNLPHFKEYWFTNYKMHYSFEEILSNFEKLDDVTTYVMWDKSWWIYSMSAKTTKKQIALHTVNSGKEIDFYFAHGVDLIYTDFI